MTTLNERREQLREVVKDFPTTAGVYLMKNDREKIIYVGKAKNLRARVRSYLSGSKDLSVKTQYLVSHIDRIDYLLTKTEVEAFLLEAALIKKYRPRYNIRLKDDKNYPYIRVSVSDAFPRFYLSRNVQSAGSVFFGPYTSGGAVRGTIRFLNQHFKIRDCSDSFMKTRKRPCMTYQIDRCTGPCVDLVSVDAYAESMNRALAFLRGDNDWVLEDLEKQMYEASSAERYEVAAKLRDSIRAIRAVLEKQVVLRPGDDQDRDVVACFGDRRGTVIQVMHLRHGRVIGERHHFIPSLDMNSPLEDPKEWFTSFLNQYYSDNIVPDELLLPFDLGSDLTKLLQDVLRERSGKSVFLQMAIDEPDQKLMLETKKHAELNYAKEVKSWDDRDQALAMIQSKLQLPRLPVRIECFDISNFQGGETVASQVVFENGEPKSEDYRRYKIREVDGPDDFKSMREVLMRRLQHSEYEVPDLILVDGGKGQLRQAVSVLAELGIDSIPVASIAKARTQGEFSDQEVSATEERFFVPGRQNPVVFPTNSEAFRILVGLRDEAHRFAISFHRKLRQNRTLESELDLVIGLGTKRKQALLKHFNSIQDLKASSPEQIAELPGFSRILAQRILIQLNEV